MTAPFAYRWTGDSFEPLVHFRKRCDEVFAIGEVHWLVPHEARSPQSHKHAFAWIRNAWALLPEEIAPLYPTPEHFRKKAMIEAGFFSEEIIDAGTVGAATRVAAYVAAKDQFQYVLVQGRFVIIRTAESQSYSSMKNARFQETKSAIMQVIADLIGITPEQLERETRSEPT